jgi:hypothetical protein
MSDQMWLQKVIGGRDGFDGFWMCPTPNCSGAGFTFDIFPTDPNHPANENWHYDDGDEDEEEESTGDDAEWDPDESKYAEMDKFGDDESDDLEGEEWKHGLQPGQRPPEPEWAADARREWEEEQKKYDEPDQRPRVVDWSDCQPPMSDDDIPF